jgi:ribonuclease E
LAEESVSLAPADRIGAPPGERQSTLPPAVVEPAGIAEVLEGSGLVLVETSAEKAASSDAAPVLEEIRGRRPKPPVTISGEPLEQVETRK